MSQFGIPPPFRGLTEADERFEDTRASYQSARTPTKSEKAPRLAAPPWREGAPPLSFAPDGTVTFEGVPSLSRALVLLPPYSPLRPREVPSTRGPRRLGVLERSTEAGWRLRLSDDVFGNGVRAASLATHGDVIEADGHEWVLQFEGAAREHSIGPLWRAFRSGALTFTDGEQRRHAVLARVRDGAEDSFERLRRLLASDFATTLESLELELESSRHDVDWATFTAAHRALATRAPFAVRLREPVLESTSSECWVVLPAKRECVKVDAHGTLTLPSTTLRWLVEPDGVRQRLGDGTLGPLVPWFMPTFGHSSECLVFIPAPSPFLAGVQGGFPADMTLTPSSARVFADELLARGDVAGELLSALHTQSGAHRVATLEKLLSPWGSNCFMGIKGLQLADAHDIGGFVTSVRCKTWPDFEDDLETLLAHPMLSRLERIEFTEPLSKEDRATHLARHPRLSIAP